MKIDAGFPRISPSGRFIACGGKVISVVDTITLAVFTLGPGTTPQWLRGDTELLYSRQPDGALMKISLGSIGELIRVPGHDPGSVATDENGRWAVEDHRVIATSWGRSIAGAFRPQFAGADLCWGVDDGAKVTLYREGQFVADYVNEHRGLPDGRLVYTVYTPSTEIDGTGLRRARLSTWVDYPDGRNVSYALRGAYEYSPNAVTINGEEWILSNTQDERLLFRTGNNGHVLATGRTAWPDIRQGVVCWEDGALELQWRRIPDSLGFVTDLRKWEFSYLPPGEGWEEVTDYTKEIDIPRALFGFKSSKARSGLPPFVKASQVPSLETLHEKRRQTFLSDDSNSVQEVKEFADRNVGTTWTYANGWIGLAYDGSNEMLGYRLVNPGTLTTAPIIPARMKVGSCCETPVEVLVGNSRAKHMLRFCLKSLWRGPYGLWACFTWDFSDHKSGLYEDNWCLLGTMENSLDEDHSPQVGLRVWKEQKKENGIPDVTTKTAFFWNPNGTIEFRPPFLYETAYPAFPKPHQPEVPPVSTLKNRDLFFQEFTRVNDFYGSDEGLQRKTPDGRPGGMIIGDQCDVVAMRQWGYDLMAGQSADQVIAQIRNSEEWRSKHAGEVEPPPNPQ